MAAPGSDGPARVSEKLAAARAEVDAACQILLSPTPEELDQCAARLAAALAHVTDCRTAAQSDVSAEQPRREAHRLGRSLRRAHRLLEAAAAFHNGWVRCLGAMCAGYTNRGEPAAVERGGRILVRG